MLQCSVDTSYNYIIAVMFTLVLGIIFLVLKFNVWFTLFNNNYFRVSIAHYEIFLIVTCRSKVLNGYLAACPRIRKSAMQ